MTNQSNDQPTITQLPEAPASITFKFAYRGYDPMLTLRDVNGVELLKKLDAAIDYIEDRGGSPLGSADDSLSFEAETLVANVADGKIYWKVKGSIYRKYGVTIWPEVLEEAGLDPTKLDPVRPVDLKGWVAYCQLNDERNPQKVVKLVRQ